MPTIEDGRGLLYDNGPPKIKIAGRRGKAEDFDANVPGLEGYVPPSEYTSILGRDEIALDLETFDPLLKTQGPGGWRDDAVGLRKSRVVGVGIAYDRRNATYYPTEHANADRCVKDPSHFYKRLKHDAEQYTGCIVGANLQYDLDWLAARHGIIFARATFADVQIAGPLIDENKRRYNLDQLAASNGLEGKAIDGLKDMYGDDYIKNMDLVDPGHAGAYCERDCLLAFEVYDKQIPILKEQELWDLFLLENELTPLLLQMRRQGVRVDLERAHENYEKTQEIAKGALDRLKELAGFRVEIWSADSLGRAYASLGIETNKTKTGKPSVTKAWLEARPDEFSKLVIDARAYDKVGGTFLNNYIIDQSIERNGDHRLHCQFHPLKTNQNGTVSGRFSSSNPNLQNIPSRHEVLGPMCREVFIPEEDHDWGCADWSQIEYRLLVHFAHVTPGIDARAVVQMYKNNPDTDFHAAAAEITNTPRKTAKNINFGVVYGIGVPHLANTLGVSLDEAKRILSVFHGRSPFIKEISTTASARAKQRGMIKTLMGRRRRFETWEVNVWGKANSPQFKTQEQAAAWRSKNPAYARGQIQRCGTHAALNALLQGSAADVMKKAMRDAWRAGVFNSGGLIPHLTVHDELDPSIPRTQQGREAWRELCHIMETTVDLSVPLLVSANTGSNWEEAK